MNKWHKLKLLALVVCVCIVFISALLPEENKLQEKFFEKATEEKVKKLTLVAVGDNLIHSPIYKSCKTGDGYNFDGLYENVKERISSADIAVINQETIFVDNPTLFSGYPAFGSPVQVGEAVVKAGFDVVTHATNHTYDKGLRGIEDTLSFWQKHREISILGINKDEKDSKSVEILSQNGIDIAMLNFTYGLNGFRLPSGKEYLVNLLDHSENTKELLKRAEENGDITIVFVHFGTEYTHVPTSQQKKDVEFLCENGADIIIGTHPHVIEPAEEYVSSNGNKSIVFYSLGNFISNQDSISKILGAMAEVTIVKDGEKTFVESFKMLPTVTHVSNRRYTAYMLEDYTDELARVHSRVPNLTVEKLENLFNSVQNKSDAS